MGSPVKVSDELATAARETAGLADRSIAKQIEHWARLGRAVEALLKSSDVMALKAHLAEPSDTEKLSLARAALKTLVEALAESRDRDAARAVITETGKPVYEAAPGRRDRVVQVWPDGREVVGRFVGAEFVPERRAAARPSRRRR